MVTHNADCLNCDFRLSKTEAKDWPEGSLRPIWLGREDYPHLLTEERNSVWGKDNLEDLPQKTKFEESRILGWIPQVAHTHGIIEGLYGMMNDKQVAIGESTCGAIYWSKPVHAGGNCLINGESMTLLGLERGSTAREAIQIMGELSEMYGFFGSAWDGGDGMFGEAGEAFGVVDPTEAWMFHIMPDSTLKSAIWVAKRVADEEVAVVANNFVIRDVHPDDPDNYMFSQNLFSEAQLAGCWNPNSDQPVDFTYCFSARPNDIPHWSYSTRRVWRVFQLLKPSLKLSPYTNPIADDYPFSVKPDKLVGADDIKKILRDHYEGTEFDLTKGIEAGPFGNVDRYDQNMSADGSTTKDFIDSGFFERAISIMRTSFSYIAVARSTVPESYAGMMWYCQYAPSATVYHPIYQQVTEIPKRLSIGSLYKYNPESNFWVAAVVGNWVNMWRMYAITDLQIMQKELESQAVSTFASTESTLWTLVGKTFNTPSSATTAAVRQHMTEFSEGRVEAMWDAYTTFFPHLMTKFHDGFRFNVEDQPVEMSVQKLFYPKSWLEATQYKYHKEHDLEMLRAMNASANPTDAGQSFRVTPQSQAQAPPLLHRQVAAPLWAMALVALSVALLSTVAGVYLTRTIRRQRGGYECADEQRYSIQAILQPAPLPTITTTTRTQPGAATYSST